MSRETVGWLGHRLRGQEVDKEAEAEIPSGAAERLGIPFTYAHELAYSARR